MIGKRAYLPAEALYTFEGLNTLDPSTLASPRTSPNLANVVVTNGIVSKRRGYTDINGGTLNGTIIALIEFETAAGVKHLIALTTTKQYRYDESSDLWVNITYQSASVDVNWTGDETNTVDYVIVTGDGGSGIVKWVIVTNGKDKPRYWDGSMSKFGLYNPNISGFVTCKTIASFYDHIVLGNVTTASVNKQLVYWSDVGKLVEFTTGSFGSQVVSDSRGQIQKLMNLGDRLIIYSDDSISQITYIGGDLIYSFELILTDTRLVAQRAIVNLGTFHLFMSQDNFLIFDGTRMIRPIGDRIYKTYRDELVVSLRHRAFGFLDAPKRQVYWAVPIHEGQSRIYLLEYDIYRIDNIKWTQIAYNDRPTCMGFSSREETLFYNSASIAGLAYKNANWTYAQGSARQKFPIRVFGSGSSVFVSDDTVIDDDGVIVESWWDSIDFTVPQEYVSETGRWTEIELELMGYEVDVLVSIDGGYTYKKVKSLDLTGEWEKYKLDIDYVSTTLRVRLENLCQDSDFSLKWLRVWVRSGGRS